MDRIHRLRPLFYEFFRYCLVGGAAFLVDAGTLTLFQEVVLPELGGCRLYIATAAGFIAGLIFNYIFSILFVFKNTKSKKAGRSMGAFAVFALIGAVGFGLTELGMYAGTALLGLHYLLVKIIVTAVVLLWNYVGRKILIFK
jgi:putative flippase GtrA